MEFYEQIAFTSSPELMRQCPYLPERGCVEDQAQQPNYSYVLRLVLRTQPRS